MRLDYKVFAPKTEATTNSELALLQHHWLLITNLIMGKTPDTFVPQPPKGIMRVGDLRFAVTEGLEPGMLVLTDGAVLLNDRFAKQEE
jgi:hypothetical protein